MRSELKRAETVADQTAAPNGTEHNGELWLSMVVLYRLVIKLVIGYGQLLKKHFVMTDLSA